MCKYRQGCTSFYSGDYFLNGRNDEVCLLVAAAGMASAQSVRGTTIVHRRPSATTVQEPVGAAAFSAGPSVSSAPARASASSAGAPAVATAAGTPGATGGLVAGQQSLGPAFYGPGLNNPLAVPLNPLVAQQAQRIAAANPNIRVISPDEEDSWTP
ncbi:hypothetical protein OTU49_012134 [Cherax quadricarinatus]|uniref:Uncharacterized protein n=1 Tax=Cherax quadricarinatus TaxID=27406 RepID=A0AAW0W0Q5_CHEQU